MKNLRVVIVEDEAVTARNLAHMLGIIDDGLDVIVSLSSVSEAVAWFDAHAEMYDLVFMDIRLADGLSFEIFKSTTITRPVIFVTAYNDYAIQAFKNNGIDYILKPFDEQELQNALNKFKSLTDTQTAEPPVAISKLLEQLSSIKSYKKSFLVHYRDKLLPLETAKINWFYTANEVVYSRTIDDRQFIMDFTMEQLEQQIDPELFFRANRQFIINRGAIIEVDFYFNGRLSVKVSPTPSERVLISKARVPEFKSWMNK